jgi:Zn-dependent peptidase ImmA (M78 family)
MIRAMRKAEELVASFVGVQPPVLVDEIAHRLGATVVFEPYSGPDAIAGMLYRKDATTVIGVNSSHSKQRQRFTIAHEIGHLLLHPGEMFLDGAYNFRRQVGSPGTNRREAEANAFAASLLMPEAHIETALERILSRNPHASPQEIAEAVAKLFLVSRQAAELRLTGLGIISVS